MLSECMQESRHDSDIRRRGANCVALGTSFTGLTPGRPDISWVLEAILLCRFFFSGFAGSIPRFSVDLQNIARPKYTADCAMYAQILTLEGRSRASE